MLSHKGLQSLFSHLNWFHRATRQVHLPVNHGGLTCYWSRELRSHCQLTIFCDKTSTHTILLILELAHKYFATMFASYSCNVMLCRGLEDNMTRPLYTTYWHLNSKFESRHTRAPVAAAPIISPGKLPLFLSNSIVGSFMSPSIWLMKEGWRRQSQRLNVTAQWRDHLHWDEVLKHCRHDLTGFLKALLAPVVQTLDSAIHRTNHYSADEGLGKIIVLSTG